LDQEQVLEGDEDSLVFLVQHGGCEGQVRGEVGCDEELLVRGK
jgi:hypothetical protein